MLVYATMLLSSSRVQFTHLVCGLKKLNGVIEGISIFLKNGKNDVQTVRLDELNSIVT
jgi:hypothetical protein